MSMSVEQATDIAILELEKYLYDWLAARGKVTGNQHNSLLDMFFSGNEKLLKRISELSDGKYQPPKTISNNIKNTLSEKEVKPKTIS